MSEPLQTANAVEPDPIPDDLSREAPIKGDIERGYVRDDGVYSTSREGVTAGGEVDRNGSSATAAVDERRGSGAVLEQKKRKSKGSGLTEGDEDMDELPKNNLWVVMPAIALVLFLAALDQTIVATALPRIAEELHASPSEYSWVGTSYTLAMTILVPINGRVSDIIGRKPILYAAIVVFTIASALCGAAKNMNWLIVCRAFQGLGGGSIVGLANIITADITPLKTRGMWQGFIGGTWGIASVLGPILGGLLTDRATWRWCFYINLPTAAIALFFLVITLKLNPRKKLTFAELKRTFDFIGLVLIMLSGALLVVGFSEAADYGFDRPRSYAMIIVGIILFALTIANCMLTKRNAIIPGRMFRNRTTLLFLIASTLHAIAFLPSNYLLPQMFQGVNGASALQSGIDLLPFACSVSWATVLAGIINSKLKIVRPVVWIGYTLAGIGFALFYGYFKYPIPYALQEGVQIICGLGVGLSLAVPILILQAAMPLKDVAATTSAWSMTRAVGGSIGIAVFTAILNSSLRSKIEVIPGYGTEFNVPTSAAGYAALHDLPDGATKDAVLGAFADSLRLCWLISAIMFFVCLVISLPTRSYSLNRTGGPKRPSDAGVSPEAEADTNEREVEGAGEGIDEKAQLAQGPSGSRVSHIGINDGGRGDMSATHYPAAGTEKRFEQGRLAQISDLAEASPTPVSERTLVDRTELSESVESPIIRGGERP